MLVRSLSLSPSSLCLSQALQLRAVALYRRDYALGTLIPTALAAVQSVEHQTSTLPGAMASPLALVSPDSLPGWVIALLAAIEFVFLLYAFHEPPHAPLWTSTGPSPGPASRAASSRRLSRRASSTLGLSRVTLALGRCSPPTTPRLLRLSSAEPIKSACRCLRTCPRRRGPT